MKNFLNTLRQFKLACTLNILGLGVAFAAFLVIIMQVRYEYNFDKCYQKSDRIYRTELLAKGGGGQIVVSQVLVDTYGELSPLIENYTLVAPPFAESYVTIENAGQKVGFIESSYGAYESFGDVFTPQMLEGSADALKEPTKVLIPGSMAERFFGRSTGVVGAKLTTTGSFSGGKRDWEVGGVYKDWPANSQLKNYMIRPLKAGNQTSWGSNNFLMFLTLRPGADPRMVEADFARNFDLHDKIDWSSDNYVGLTKLTDVYYDTREGLWAGDLDEKGNRSTTNILLSIALLIIVVAAINFINFSTSLAPLRIKGINIRKILGSSDFSLRAGLVVEAVGIAMIAVIVGLFIVSALAVSSLSHLTLSGIAIEGNGDLVWLTVAVAAVVGLIAGIYPAFYTTKFSPVMVIKGSFGSSKSGRALRTTLIGFQFVVSIGLIIGAIFLQLQNSYMRHADTGIDMENVAIVKLAGELAKSKSFEQNLRQSAQITDVGFSFSPIAVGNLQQGWGKKINDKQFNFDAIVVSWNVPQMLGVKLVDGGYFTEKDANKNTRTYLFNKKAAAEFDITTADRVEDWDADTMLFGEIRGITENFNYKSLHNEIGAMAFAVEGSELQRHTTMPVCYIAIKGDPYAAVEHIKRTAAAIDPAYPLDIRFFDAAFDAMYQHDQQTTGLIALFSILAIIISLVGVFGLVVFETQFRRREIGLRKVYGSTVAEILAMFSRRFVWIVVTCFVIAAPLAYVGVTMWLKGFASRISLHWWVFAVALIIVMLITLVTVVVQSYRAATENPINSIKS